MAATLAPMRGLDIASTWRRRPRRGRPPGRLKLAFSWYSGEMLPSRRRLLAAMTLLAALSTARPAASQPIEPLQSAPPAAPPAPPDVAEAPGRATRTASGLAWKVLSKGHGTAHPGPHDKVSVTFTGWSPDGEVI